MTWYEWFLSGVAIVFVPQVSIAVYAVTHPDKLVHILFSHIAK